jgi:hypothetical protein
MTTRRVKSVLYLDHSQVRALKELSAKTRIPVSVFIREAVQDLLTKYKKKS